MFIMFVFVPTIFVLFSFDISISKRKKLFNYDVSTF